MPKFKFTLEPLLDHRRHIEREHKRRVGEIQQQLNSLVAKIQNAQRGIADLHRNLASEKLTGTLDLTFIAHEKRYVGTLQLLIAQTLQELAAVEKTMAAAKAELRAAAVARKVIEKLREKQFQRFLLEESRKDAAFTDEIGTQLAIRELNDLNNPGSLPDDHVPEPTPFTAN